LEARIASHQAIRENLLKVFNDAGLVTQSPQSGSYLYPKLPELAVSMTDFVGLLRVQANVTVTPGTEFSPHDVDRIRLNFSQDHKAAVAAAKRIVEMTRLYAK
jgi:aspartate/methionine/tyrosine aminotransferase